MKVDPTATNISKSSASSSTVPVIKAVLEIWIVMDREVVEMLENTVVDINSLVLKKVVGVGVA